MQLKQPVCSFRTQSNLLSKWAVIVGISQLVFSTTAVPAFAVTNPFSPTAGAPPACYLDLSFLPQENVLNKTMLSLDDHGVNPFVKYWGDFLTNTVGGKYPGVADWNQTLVYGVKLDLERLIGWTGGEFIVSAVSTAGRNLADAVGTGFTPSQAMIFNGTVNALYMLYFTQHLLDDKLELKIGRSSAATFYATLPMMGLPIFGGIDASPSAISHNTAGFHACGRANWMVNIKVRPTQDTYLQTGIWQVTKNRMNASYFNGLDFSFRSGDGIMLLAEAGWSPTFLKAEGSIGDHACQSSQGMPNEPFNGLPGLYEFGGYYQNYSMPTFLGSGSIQHAYGFYLQGQQMLWRSRMNQNHSFTIWDGITFSPQQQIAELPLMVYGGLEWTGLIPGRDLDKLLLNYYIGRYSHDYSLSHIRRGLSSNTVETVFEMSYIIQLTRQLRFQPDLQWYIQPGGSSHIPNALVLGFEVAFVY